MENSVIVKTVKCELCGKELCPKCNVLATFIKWKICSECYNPYSLKCAKRISKTKEKRKIRKENDKSKGEFTITFDNGLLLRDLIKYLNESFDVIYTNISPKILQFTGMDPGRISFVIVRFNLEKLIEYKFNFSNQTQVFEPSDLFTALEELKEQTPISLCRKKGAKDIEVKYNTDRFVIYDTKTDYEQETDFGNIFKIPYNNVFEIKPAELLSILENVKKKSEIVCVRMESDQVKFHNALTQGIYYEHELEFLNHHELPDFFKEQGYYEVYFNLYFLYHLVKNLQPWIRKDIVVYIKFDNPLRLDVQIEGGHQIIIFVAPRVEGSTCDDDENDNDNDEEDD